MSASNSDNEMLTPENIRLEATSVINSLLPEKSKRKYLIAYQNFLSWKTANSAKSFSEAVFLAYFLEISKHKQPSTLWSIYSMLKATVSTHNNVEIKNYARLVAFLKRKSEGHKPKKSKVLTVENVNTFLNEAPEHSFLALKVALIFGVCGACRGIELLNITVDDVKKHADSLIVVDLKETKTKIDRFFVIQGDHVKIVEKYQSLRPNDMKNKRFFINYHNGKCTKQVIGKNKISGMPREVAMYLNLPNPDQYTGHCFRRTSATILADTGAGMTAIKRLGGWKSATVAAGYIENSVENKAQLSRRIHESINKNRPSSPQPGTSAQARAEEAEAQPQVAAAEPASVEKPPPSPTFTATQGSQISQQFTEQNTQINKTNISVPNKHINLTFQNCTNVTINF